MDWEAEGIKEDIGLGIKRFTNSYLKIAYALYPNKQLSFKELLIQTGLSRPVLSKVLKRLVKNRLIIREVKSKKTVFYRLLDPYYLSLIEKCLSPMFRRLLSLEGYNMLFSKIIGIEWEIEKQLEFFYSAAASQPKARVLYEFGPDGYEAIYLYPIERGNERIKIELNYTEFIQELGLECYELIPQPPHHFIKRPTFPLAKLLPYRLTLSQCLERLLHHFNQIMLTEEELERLGIKIYRDHFGIYFDRSGWEKIFQLKEKRKIYMSIQRPRNETINKILNLTRLIYLSENSLKECIKIKPIII
jgi:DNA-binding transcriptional ArsR family regulator